MKPTAGEGAAQRSEAGPGDGAGPRHVLYVGAALPSRSETFVTREVLGLRDRGLRVSVASVHPPERGLGDPRLEALADEARVVYRPGMLRRALRSAARRPDVLARGLLDAACGRDVPWRRRPRLLWQCLGGLALGEELRGAGVEHVHAHMAHVPTSVAMYAARTLRVPFSFTGHAADLFRDRALLPDKLERAAFVSCISEWHREHYLGLARLDRERLPVIRCGVDLPAPAPSPAGPDLLAVGRLVPKKGFDVLIEALARLEPARRPAVDLVGDGPQADALRALARARGLEGAVRFLGAQPNTRVRELMQTARAVVLPCRVSDDGDRDGIPVVLMEAMAAGIPVISGDLPTIRELVQDGVTGLMVAPGDATALATALERLLAEPEQMARLAAAGRARVAEEFALDANLDRLQAALSGAARRGA